MPSFRRLASASSETAEAQRPKATVRGHTAFILEAQPIFGISLTYAFIRYRSCVVKLRSYGYRKRD